jgi:hypothetical protein
MVWTIPTRLILKLSWDNERSASSNFGFAKQKKSTEAKSGKWQIVLTTSPPFELLDWGVGLD